MKRTIRLREHLHNDKRIFIPDDDLLTKCPSLIREENILRSDENGFVISGNNITETKKTTIILGDSFVTGDYISEQKRFCSLVESKDFSNQTNLFGTILNGGYSGNTTLNIINRLMNVILPMKVDTILFILPSNDTQIYRLESLYWNKSTYYSNILPDDPNISFGGFELLDVRALNNLLRLMIEISKIYNFNLIFSTTPFSKDWDNNLFAKDRYKSKIWFLESVSTMNRLNDAVRLTANSYNIPLIDLETQLSNEDFYDIVHLNENGSQKCADIIYDFFANKKK